MGTARLLLAAALIGGCSHGREGREQPVSTDKAPRAEAAAPAASCRFRGQIVDESGRPLPGAQVSDLWTFEEGAEVQPFAGLETDGGGRFDGEFEPPPGKDFCLAAYSRDRKLAGLAMIESKQVATGAPQDVRIVARPTVRVRGRVKGSESGVPAWTSFYWICADKPIVQCAMREPAFDVPMPQGDWRWLASGTDLESRRGNLEISSKKEEVDLGIIEVPTNVLAKLRGQKLPEWTVTASRGLPEDRSTLAGFQGKWVLIAFWGTWSEACVQETLPRLVAFCASQQEERDRYEVIAFHDSSVRSLDELDMGIAYARERAWERRDLPFPLLLDATGDTVRKYGIRSFPTTILVDPEGRLVGEADENELKKRLESERSGK